MQTLEFRRTERIRKPIQQYFDFIVGGQSLKKILRADDRDLVTPFGWLDRGVEDERIKEFKGQAIGQAEPGRIMIYVCPECLDIGCGAITAALQLTKDTVIWKNFGYENDFEEIDFEPFKHIFQVKFDRQDYMSRISKL